MEKLTATQIRDGFLKGDFSAVEIARFFLDRIEQNDSKIGAFLRTFPDKAIAHAKMLDEKRSSGRTLGKLAAVPIAIKDNIHIQGELTTCGSKFLTNFKAPFEATVIRLLGEADALFIGKTNLDEFAMGSSTENSALQKTCNPFNTNLVPGGSSGGSAAAVSARFSPLALGSDTGGSIRQPAALTGIVGYKPTYGRVSRYGLVAFGSSLDQIGPFATNVPDAALVMEVIGKHCEKDSTSLPEEALVYLKNPDKSIKGMKIGVPWEFLDGLSHEARAVFERTLNELKELGADIVSVDLSILKYSLAVYYILATAEASTNLARFDGVRYGVRSEAAKTLNEVYDLSKEEGFGPEVKRRILLGTFVLSAGYQDAYYRKAQRVRTLLIQEYRKAFEACDLIAMPTSPSPAFAFGAEKDPLEMYLKDIYTISINLAGLPAISLPNGFTSEGLPWGFQLIGPQKEDVRVIKAAYAFETAHPEYTKLPTLEDLL